MAGRGPAEIPALNEASAALYRSHRLSLLRLAAFLVDERATAEELVQDAFYQRWKSVADKSAAPSYLRATVVNGARSAQRRQGIVRRHLRIAERDGPSPSTRERSVNLKVQSPLERVTISAAVIG